MKTFIFDLNNNSERTLAGSDATSYTQRYQVSCHPRVVEKRKKTRQGTTLSNLKDGRIFYFSLIVEYIRTEYGTKTWLPLSVIQDAISNNWINSLAYFCQLKSLHHRPIIYKRSLRSISSQIKVSPATLSFHLKVLVSKGLISLTGEYLALKSNNEFHLTSQVVPVGVSFNKQEQITLLRFTILKRNLHSQQKAFQKKSDTLSIHNGNLKIRTKADYKRAKRLIRTTDITNLESSIQDCFTASNFTIGRLCGRSQSTGIRIQKSFNNLNLVKSFKRVKKVSTEPMSRRSFFAQELSAEHFLSNRGYSYKRLSNGLVLGEYVLFQKLNTAI